MAGPQWRGYERKAWISILCAAAASILVSANGPTRTLPQMTPEQRAAEIARLTQKAEKTGTVNVIVGFKLAEGYVPEAKLADRDAVGTQRAAIIRARDALLASLRAAGVTEYAKWDALPLVALRVDVAALRLLAGSSLMTTIQEDAVSTPQAADQRAAEIARLTEKAEKTGTVNIIVGLKLPDGYVPEPALPDAAAVERQRTAIARARDALVGSLPAGSATVYAKWDPLPSVAIRVNAAALRVLAGSLLITTIKEDGLSRPQK